jgi:RNA polymerase sigma-70 factor (ECF subfamily)
MKDVDDQRRVEQRRRRVELMVRLQQGDANACRQLLDDIGPSVVGFLRRRIADPNEVEDVYQEVMLALFEARHTYQPERPLEPWLFAIARNIAADHTRQHFARASWQELVGTPPELATATAPPSSEPDLAEYLGRLPPAQREAFSMLKLEGMSVELAAARTGVSAGALKVRAHRAYKTLKKLIGG